MNGSTTDKGDIKSSEAEILRDVLQNSSRGDLWRIISFLKPFKMQFFLLLGIVVLSNICALLRPWIIGRAINGLGGLRGRAADPGEMLRFVWLPAATYFIFGVGFSALISLRPRATMRLSAEILRHLRMLVYARIQRLSFDHLDRLTTGQLIERAIGDVNQIRMFLTGSFVMVFDAFATVAIMLGFMISMSGRLTLVVLAPLPLIVLLFGRINRRIRQGSRRTRDAVDVMTTQLTEGIEGVKVIRSFAAEPRMVGRYRAVLVKINRLALKVARIQCFEQQAMFQSARLIQGLVLAVGGVMAIHGHMEIGFFVVYLFYVSMLVAKVQPLMDAAAMSQEARAAFERIAALVDVSGLIEDAPDARGLPAGGGKIVFRNVNFAYQPAPQEDSDVTERMKVVRPSPSPRALRDINLEIPAGAVVALIGPTGSGKSTLVNLLPRFYDPSSGQVELDGVDLRKIRLTRLRNAIGFVFQETVLFKGTLGDNIAFGFGDYSMADVKVAARLAQADGFIEELPGGYDSRIGERGVSLSGGQRQRIAIARALLMDPRILILDDATASVDPTTEFHIRNALKELMVGRTTIIIAHRLATIRTADMIVVMRDGRIEDVGDHETLAAGNQFYRDLLETQSLLANGQSNGEQTGGEQ